MNLEQIWSAFRKVEKAEDLGEWRVGDVYLWQVIRERMFTHIAEQTGLYLPVPEKPEIKAAKQASLQAAEIAIMPFVRRRLDPRRVRRGLQMQPRFPGALPGRKLPRGLHRPEREPSRPAKRATQRPLAPRVEPRRFRRVQLFRCRVRARDLANWCLYSLDKCARVFS